MRPARMTFGVFNAPYHPLGDNPTLAIRRDIELIEWLDYLGYDECWIGEHHSGGWEIISDPALIIAAAAERTKRIRLGSGVASLPYHNPLILADRYVQLDHMTQGRVLLGVGPGALPSDAYMLGLDVIDLRQRMDEALDVIVRLLAGETVTRQTAWFHLREARLQLLPFSDPCFPIAVSSVASPAGMAAAGKYGVGVLSVGAQILGGVADLQSHWRIAEEEAAQHGRTVRRQDWRLALRIHVAETREQAINEIEAGRTREDVHYWQQTFGFPGAAALDQALASGAVIAGDPDDVAAAIERMLDLTGGFGGVLLMGNDWASREATWRSYELFARWVAPRFQRAAAPLRAANGWFAAHSQDLFRPAGSAVAKAYQDAGRTLPPDIARRQGGLGST